ncbi:MAG: metallophosphoesterase family protein [Flavobacteriales bacterium]
MKTFIIGDIHGGYNALVELMEKVPYTSSDRFIFIGDLVDGWSDSARVIQFLMEFSSEYDCIFIKGNHDEWCQRWLKNGWTSEIWLANGGQETIDSYQSFSEEVKQSHFEFFNNMEEYFVDEHNNLFIHAGFTSRKGPQSEHYTSNYRWDRTLWEMALSIDPSIQTYSAYYPERLKLFKEIFIGHTPTTNYNSIDFPMHRANVWNVDTGAAFKGKISCLQLDTKSYYQSKPVFEYYPDEKGRNKNQ